ncbi:hypothetical protein F2P79_008425 [Pimephales promelas]|nr:hypothetical protein F2P79_008425 [Pimephales promelas]
MTTQPDPIATVIGQVPKGLNYKCFFDNWFTSPELIVELKKMGILTVATINRNRLRGCTLKSDEELSKAGRGAYEVKYEKTSEPIERCRRWSKEKKEYVEVEKPLHCQVADALIKVGKQADLNSRKRGQPPLEDDPSSPHAAPPPPLFK